jgi:hypothetical protein
MLTVRRKRIHWFLFRFDWTPAGGGWADTWHLTPDTRNLNLNTASQQSESINFHPPGILASKGNHHPGWCYSLG